MTKRNRKSGLVDQWAKGRADVVRVELTKFQGHNMIGVRVWRRRENGKDQPIRNGINLTVEHLPRLINALRRARKKAVEDGWLPEDNGS